MAMARDPQPSLATETYRLQPSPAMKTRGLALGLWLWRPTSEVMEDDPP